MEFTIYNGHVLGVFWVYSWCIVGKFWAHSARIMNVFWVLLLVHSGCIMDV